MKSRRQVWAKNGPRRRPVLDEDHGDLRQEEEEEEGRQGGQGPGPRVRAEMMFAILESAVVLVS